MAPPSRFPRESAGLPAALGAILSAVETRWGGKGHTHGKATPRDSHLWKLALGAFVLLNPIGICHCADADPLLGVYGYPLCPYVCPDCRGPVRVVTVWRQVGPGNWSTKGPEYFCRTKEIDMARMSEDEIEKSRDRFTRQRLSGVAALAASYLTVFIWLAPFATYAAIRRTKKDRGRMALLHQEIPAIAAQLGQEVQLEEPGRKPSGFLDFLGVVLILTAASLLVALGI